MVQIHKDDANGIIKISEELNKEIGSNFIFLNNDCKIITIKDLYGIEKLKSFEYKSEGEDIDEEKYLLFEYRITRDFKKFTNWFSLESTIKNFPEYDTKEVMNIEIRVTRVGTNKIGYIILNEYELIGNLERNIIKDSEYVAKLSPDNNRIVIKPPFIYKVFNIKDLEILYKGDLENMSIKYRYSQDYGRTVSQWEPLNKDNITTMKISPIRFFQIEYLIEGTEGAVYDINLIGDFQNVTMDYLKTNLYGVRENCNCLILGIENGTINTDNQSDGDKKNPNGNGRDESLGLSCSGSGASPLLTEDEKNNLFNPYDNNNISDFLDRTNDNVNSLFGHEVYYFITDADKNGIDYSFHEYQLKNYVCDAKLKVSVDQNLFPSSEISINKFDLSLFESFEVHIPKRTFKEAFGLEKRPAKDDFLWFCKLNLLYQVENAQQMRTFNNLAVQYKLILKKFVQKANIISVNKEMEDKVRELTRNSTIEELFGKNNSEDKKSISNTKQLEQRTVSKEPIRNEISAKIESHNLSTNNLLISDSYYNMSSVKNNMKGVVYKGMDINIKKGNNLSFSVWFNMNNYFEDEKYSLFDCMVNNKGFEVYIKEDNVTLKVNEYEYKLDMTYIDNYFDGVDILEGNWLCYSFNLNQRQQKLKQYLYKVNANSNINELELLHSDEVNINPISFKHSNINSCIYGSDLKLTNLRLYSDVINENDHNKILMANIVSIESKYLILGDNANRNLLLPNHNLSMLDSK